MTDPAVLARAIRTGTRLREKLVVLEIDPAAAGDAAVLEAVAADLALARALGIRLVAACDPGSGPRPLDGLGPALRLVAALERKGERGVTLPAAGVVTVHRIPAAAVAAAPGVPSMIPVVNAPVLIHLSALGYIPILVPPAVDGAGEGVTDLAAEALAGLVARFMSAAMLVLPSGRAAPSGDTPGLPALPPVVVTGPAAPGTLIADILLNAPEMPAAPAGIPGAGTPLVLS